MVSCWAQEAAEQLQIEKHLLYVSAVGALSCNFQSERLAREGRVPLTPETQNVPITDIPGLPPLQPGDLPSLFLSAETYNWMKYNDYRMAMADVVLTNSFYDLEKRVIVALQEEVIGTGAGVKAKHVLDIGPMLPEAYFTDGAMTDDVNLHSDEETDPCILWLNTQKPSSVLYVSFGSYTTHRAPQLLELALGLEASDQPFLWILRPPDWLPAHEATGASTSMTEFLPPGFEERTKGRGMCYSGWAPQLRILKHVATGVFLARCGWNSILESVCAGVPMLTWPFWADQNLNSRFLVDTAKLAIELEREPIDPAQDLGEDGKIERRVRKEEIERKIRKLMQQEGDRTIRHNTQEMKQNARRAVASGGSSTRNFEHYVSLLRSAPSSAHPMVKF